MKIKFIRLYLILAFSYSFSAFSMDLTQKVVKAIANEDSNAFFDAISEIKKANSKYSSWIDLGAEFYLSSSFFESSNIKKFEDLKSMFNVPDSKNGFMITPLMLTIAMRNYGMSNILICYPYLDPDVISTDLGLNSLHLAAYMAGQEVPKAQYEANNNVLTYILLNQNTRIDVKTTKGTFQPIVSTGSTALDLIVEGRKSVLNNIIEHKRYESATRAGLITNHKAKGTKEGSLNVFTALTTALIAFDFILDRNDKFGQDQSLWAQRFVKQYDLTKDFSNCKTDLRGATVITVWDNFYNYAEKALGDLYKGKSDSSMEIEQLKNLRTYLNQYATQDTSIFACIRRLENRIKRLGCTDFANSIFKLRNQP